MIVELVPDSEFFEECLFAIEGLILEKGWRRTYDLWKDRDLGDNSLDLVAAIELVAELYAEYAETMGYPELKSLAALSAEIKGYLSNFTPVKRYEPFEHMSLDHFNDDPDTDIADLCELLELAIEYYRPHMTGFRNDFSSKKFITSYDINILHPQRVGSGIVA